MNYDNFLKLFQTNLGKKFTEIESYYYPEIDELVKKMDDLDLHGITAMPSFDLTQFSFIKEWLNGTKSSEEIVKVFDQMDLEAAAKAKLTKRLVNYMMNNEVACDYFKPVIARIDDLCVARMVRYLEVMHKFFIKLAESDKNQVPITWLEQYMSPGDTTSATWELTLNQVIRQIDGSIIGNVKDKFFFDKNVLVLDEVNDDDRTIHWLFAPESYISLLKTLYQVKEELSGASEKEYLQNVLKSRV